MPLSELNKRRINNFKRNKRGYICFWLFVILFVVSLFAEFIANDKPIVIFVDGKSYFPVIKQYSETDLGGDFETEANYKDPYLLELLNEKNAKIIWAPIKYSYNTINYDLKTPAPSSPDMQNLLGTDDQGRDVLARVIYGFRISILFGFSLTILSSIVGVFAGAIQGYFGGKIDLIFQRFIEVWSGLPMLFMLIILSSLVVPNFYWLLLIMFLFSWTSLVGVVRAEFLKARSYQYVTAAKALGVKERTIIIRHVLPNALVSAVTFMPFILTGAITTLTSLDFLGFGLPAGSASLGELLAQGKNNLQAPWLGVAAFTVLASMLLLLMFIGEALRDALDPRKSWQ